MKRRINDGISGEEMNAKTRSRKPHHSTLGASFA
jgi:hypothetical protein